MARRSLKSGVLRNRFELGEERSTRLGEICPSARERFPFYFSLPHDDPIALLKWRIYCRQRCIKDTAFRAAVWEMCRRDVAFFAVTFGVLFEPRPMPRQLPFHLWTDQVSLLSWFTEIFGERDGAVNKTRGIGLSWLCALFFFHKWLFYPEVTMGVLTKDKDLLDSSSPNSLIGKFIYLFDHMPAWAQYTAGGAKLLNRSIEKTMLVNLANGAVIQGFVSTSTKLRQLRFTAIFADEFAFYDRTDQSEWMVSSGGTTNCRLMVSTWNDFDDEFHKILYEEESALLKMHAFWWDNNERWRGAYKMEAGRVVLVDKNYRHAVDYEFGIPDLIAEGELRSPWVDAELSRPGIDRIKALRDIYGMKVAQHTNAFFGPDVQEAMRAAIEEPAMQGLLDVSTGSVKVIPTLKGNIRLWGGVPERNRGPYVMGCDLAMGVGSAFSVCCVLDSGGEQVLEYGTNQVKITPFAHECVLIARWLAGREGDGWVTIDFEANGQQAQPFGAELTRLNYGAIHMSENKWNSKKRLPTGEIPKYLGSVNRDSGNRNFAEMGRAIMAMECRLKSERIANDMRTCGKDDDGHPKFPIGRKDGHGDYCHAAGISWWRARSFASVENRGYNEEGTDVMTNPFDDDELDRPRRWSDNWKQVA